MEVWEFEEAVWRKDGVRVVVRAPNNAEVGSYQNANAASDTLSVTGYVKNRVKPNIGPFEAAVVDGDGSFPHGRTKLSRVRATYRR